jgi:hypothetical protein
LPQETREGREKMKNRRKEIDESGEEKKEEEKQMKGD